MMPGLSQESSPTAAEGALGMMVPMIWQDFAEPSPLD